MIFESCELFIERNLKKRNKNHYEGKIFLFFGNHLNFLILGSDKMSLGSY